MSELNGIALMTTSSVGGGDSLTLRHLENFYDHVDSRIAKSGGFDL